MITKDSVHREFDKSSHHRAAAVAARSSEGGIRVGPNTDNNITEKPDYYKPPSQQYGEEPREAKKCDLCERSRPVFAGDLDLKGLPPTALSPFLRQLQINANDKLKYLNKLRITAKFIRPCKCFNRDVHSYCLTVDVIQ